MERRARGWLAVGLIAALALALRLKDPLSTVVIGAEDPYVHMARTYDFLQYGDLPEAYPPGFAVLLAPVALLGPEAFYHVARLAPAVLGVIEVLGVYLLCRRYMRPAGAYTAALLVAVMPENIFRTVLLFPTALDLAILPFLMLLVMRGSQGHAPSLVGIATIFALMLFIHPWFVALCVVPLGLFALVVYARRDDVTAAHVSGVVVGGAALGALVLFVPGMWKPARIARFLDEAWSRFVELALDPSSLWPPPEHVNLPWMLTVPALILAAGGVWVAIKHRERIGLLALIWSGALLPIVVVDWFDVWYIPHRTVVYLSVGIALLAALPIHRIAQKESDAPDLARRRAAALFLVALLAFTLPAAAQTQTWYRRYEPRDYEAWHAIADDGAPLVVAGSWQARVGYRAITGEPAIYVPAFFVDPAVRDQWIGRQPNLVVLMDHHAREQGYDRAWLDDWKVVGKWGNVTAYQPP